MAGRTGVLAFWKNYDRKLYVRAAKLADELGYDSFWIPEAWGYEIFSLLTEMAMETSRIQLGTGIVNCFSRSPGLIAMNAATVDEISGGRLILGLGTSGKKVIEGFHARAYRRPLTQLRDVIRVVRALLSGGNLLEAGAKLDEYRPFELAMEPLRPDVPIYVAALKEKSIRSIGELADGWIPAFWPFDRFDVGRKWIEEGAAKAGRDASKIVTAPYANVIPLPGEMGAKMAKDIIAFYIGGMGDYYRELLTGFGFKEECDEVCALYADKETRRKAKYAVSDRMMNALTIPGDPDHCYRELQRRREGGMDLPILVLPPDAPWEMHEAFLRAMAPRPE